MFLFLIPHLLDNCATLRVLRRQAIQVAVEVSADLSLGLGYEAQAPSVAKRAAGRTNCEGAGVPEGTELADVLTKLIYTLLAPREMIELLIRGTLHLCFDILVARNRGVALVEGLRGHFARVINPHQARCVPLLSGIQIGIKDVFRRIFAGGTTRRRGYRAERVVCTR